MFSLPFQFALLHLVLRETDGTCLAPDQLFLTIVEWSLPNCPWIVQGRPAYFNGAVQSCGSNFRSLWPIDRSIDSLSGPLFLLVYAPISDHELVARVSVLPTHTDGVTSLLLHLQLTIIKASKKYKAPSIMIFHSPAVLTVHNLFGAGCPRVRSNLRIIISSRS